LGEIVDRHREPADAVCVAERRDRAQHAHRKEHRLAVGHQAVALCCLDEPAHVGRVDVAALPHHRAQRFVGALDVEQREVHLVLGHEPHTGLGALPDASDGIGGGIHRRRLRSPQAEAHGAYQLAEQ